MTILSNVFSPSGPISNAIETATTVTASREEDWQLIIDICNLVNSRPEGPKEAAKAVRKRIKTKQVGTQLLTITLMQSLFDNCGAKYRVAISNSKFTETLAKLMSRSDTDPEVRSKLYVALTSWAEQLRGEPGMEAIPALYDNLNTITTLTPSDDNNNDNMRSSHLEAMSPEKMQKEVPRLVEICHNSVEMLSESLVYTDPDTEDIRKNEFIQEFYVKCKNLQTEVGRFIASAQDEQLIDQLLKANQELLDVFQQYDEIVERHDIVSATNRSAADMAQFSSATSSSPSTNPPNSNGHEYAKQSSSNPFNDQHQPAGISSTAMGKQPQEQPSISFPSVEPYRVAPPPQSLQTMGSQNPFDDILAYSDANAAEAQLSAPMAPMLSMPAAPLLPTPAETSPMGWHINGMSSASTSNRTETTAPIVTRDEHGNQHAII